LKVFLIIFQNQEFNSFKTRVLGCKNHQNPGDLGSEKLGQFTRQDGWKSLQDFTKNNRGNIDVSILLRRFCLLFKPLSILFK